MIIGIATGNITPVKLKGSGWGLTTVMNFLRSHWKGIEPLATDWNSDYEIACDTFSDGNTEQNFAPPRNWAKNIMLISCKSQSSKFPRINIITDPACPSSALLDLFWASSFHTRTHPSLSNRRDRDQKRAHSAINKNFRSVVYLVQ